MEPVLTRCVRLKERGNNVAASVPLVRKWNTRSHVGTAALGCPVEQGSASS